ncbi:MULTISPECIES: DUF3658 domain-containing protein [Azorhizobium]|nr:MULTISPECIES: DUF3658 domain-containing protein [Azorhizobium]
MEMDDLILASCHDRWQKVAMVIVKVMEKTGELGERGAEAAIATRIEALADAGRLAAAGDLKDWRHSEIRLAR